jgi:hypothetical protein
MSLTSAEVVSKFVFNISVQAGKKSFRTTFVLSLSTISSTSQTIKSHFFAELIVSIFLTFVVLQKFQYLKDDHQG